MNERGPGEPGHERGVLDRVPEPPAAPAQRVVGPAAAQRDADGEKGPGDGRPRPRPARPCRVEPPAQQRRDRERERDGKADVAHVEHRRMDHHPRILQQRIQVASFGRGRHQPVERIRGEEQEEQESHAHPTHHRDHPGEQHRRQVAREERDGERPAGEHQCPQQERAFVRAPGRGEAIVQRQLGIRIRRHVLDREVIPDERCSETGEGDHDEQELRARRGSCKRHQPRLAVCGAGQRQRGLRDRNQQREDQREVAELGNHLRSPCLVTKVLVDIASCACFTASAAAGGM